MSRRLQDTYRQLLASESGLSPPPWGGRLSVALVCPSTYHQGMSNLGVQMVYSMLNSLAATRCERFFLPASGDIEEHRRSGFPLLSLETGRPIVDFDLIAFSISFENDYLNLPPLFQLLQIPLFRRDRSEKYPLLLCGGVCAFLNPEPLAEVMDLFAIGEAEPILPGMIELLQSRCDVPRQQLFDELSTLPGLYVPEQYRVDYDAQGFPVYRSVAGGPGKVARQWVKNIDERMAMSCVLTPSTEFADMRLIEVSRGCPRACRFCAAGFIYRPFRQHSLEVLTRELADAPSVDRTGLVAAAVTDSEALVQFGRAIQAGGGEVSVSSVRIDAISEAEVAMLADSGHKTLALAPEAGSQRLRDLLNKGIDEEQILAAVTMIAQGGIPNLKLYFMVGLPGENSEDVGSVRVPGNFPKPLRLTLRAENLPGAVQPLKRTVTIGIYLYFTLKQKALRRVAHGKMLTIDVHPVFSQHLSINENTTGREIHAVQHERFTPGTVRGAIHLEPALHNSGVVIDAKVKVT